MLQEDALLLGLKIARRILDPHLRLAFNSLSAGASVNHLHYQFWKYPRALPVERATYRRVGERKEDHLQLYQAEDYPLDVLKVDFSQYVLAFLLRPTLPSLNDVSVV